MIVRFRSVAMCFVLLALSASAAGAQGDAWKEYSSVSDGFAVSGPFAPTQSKSNITTTFGPVELRAWAWDQPVTMIVFVSDYASLNNLTTTEILNNSAESQVKSLAGGRMISKTSIVLQGVSGVECLMDGDTNHAHTRIYFQGRRMWQLITISPLGNPGYAQIDRMFASFRFLPPSQF